jgi:hypothetical protein
MDSLPIVWVQPWLTVATATLGPLIALIVGFEGGRLVPPAEARERCDYALTAVGSLSDRLS